MARRKSHPRTKGSHKGPLRKIVSYRRNEYDSWEEVLECGHAQLRGSDMFGETNAARRRCRKCKRGAPADVAPDPAPDAPAPQEQP